MRSPAEEARTRIDAWSDARARAEVAGARGGGAEEEAERAVGRARGALGSGELREAMREAASMGLFGPDEHGALLSLLALAARDEVFARRSIEPMRAREQVLVQGAPRTLGELARSALEDPDAHARAQAAAAIAEADDRDRARRLEARHEADAIGVEVRARGPRPADASPDDLPVRAARFLDATDDAAREIVARAAHAASAPPPRTAHDVLVLLRAPRVDPLVSRRGRPRRLAALLAPLGLEDALAQRAQVASPHGALDLDARVIALDPPRRVTILPSPLELGLASELALARAIGGALAACSVAPALPSALRRAWPGSVGRGIGELLGLLHAEAPFVRRARGLEGAAADALRRAALAIAVLRARALAARATTEAISGRERGEGAATALTRALGVDDPTMPAAFADPGTLAPEERAADLRAALLAPALSLALRDRFDEDWFRNPRAAEPLRAAAARGGALSIESWAEELGASSDRASVRLAELVR